MAPAMWQASCACCSSRDELRAGTGKHLRSKGSQNTLIRQYPHIPSFSRFLLMILGREGCIRQPPWEGGGTPGVRGGLEYCQMREGIVRASRTQTRSESDQCLGSTAAEEFFKGSKKEIPTCTMTQYPIMGLSLSVPVCKSPSSVRPSVRPSVCLSDCLPLCHCVCLSVCLFNCVCMRLCVCLRAYATHARAHARVYTRCACVCVRVRPFPTFFCETACKENTSVSP